MHKLAQLDHQFVWHPFTQMREWLQQEPIVIVEGQGAVLRDVQGKEYLDANSSIWTNLHGHRHPVIDTAVQRQLGKIAHSSALGFANEPASLLAAELVQAANEPALSAPVAGIARRAGHPSRSVKQSSLQKVFFSDDGSTAMEVALKLAYEYARRSGRSRRPKFLSLAGAYHGDTVGAVSLGHIDLFHKAYSGLLFKTETVPAPYCYRCQFNRARPERVDARESRKCNWECVSLVEKKIALQRTKGNPFAAMVVEPLMQGAAGMIPQPSGWLSRVAELVRSDGAQLIADEVMTGFGRTGPVFACHSESVEPDFLAIAKGLTGGYLPMAATLTTGRVFNAFLGDYAEFKTFFHGHSYTGNQLGAAAARASLKLVGGPSARRARERLAKVLERELQCLWQLKTIGDIRRVGLVAGIELVRDARTRVPFDRRERAGIRICEAMAKRGVLTRPIGNVIVLMPPYCTTPEQIRCMTGALFESVAEVLEKG